MIQPESISPGAVASRHPQEVVLFRIAGVDFGIDLRAVAEIRAVTPITTLPHAPMHCCGVLARRGEMVPVFDPAAMIGMPPTDPTAHHVLIFVTDGVRECAILAETTIDITSVRDPVALRPTDPQVGSGLAFGNGVLTVDGEQIRFVELGRMLSAAMAVTR